MCEREVTLKNADFTGGLFKKKRDPLRVGAGTVPAGQRSLVGLLEAAKPVELGHDGGGDRRGAWRYEVENSSQAGFRCRMPSVVHGWLINQRSM